MKNKKIKKLNNLKLRTRTKVEIIAAIIIVAVLVGAGVIAGVVTITGDSFTPTGTYEFVGNFDFDNATIQHYGETADFIIFKDVDTGITYCKSGNNGTILFSSNQDDRVIQYAINYTSGAGVHIYISKPRGDNVYLIDQSIILPSGWGGYTLQGGGHEWYKNGTILQANTTLSYIIDDRCDTNGMNKYHSLSFYGKYTTYGGVVVGLKTLCKDVIVEYCSFFDCADGIYVKGNAFIDKNWIEGNFDTGLIISGTKPKITGNVFWDNDEDIMITGDSIDGIISGNTAKDSTNFIYYNTANPMSRMQISNNIVTSMGSYFLWLKYSCNHLVITDNTCDGDSDTTNFIRLGEAQSIHNISVKDNSVYNLTSTIFYNDNKTGCILTDDSRVELYSDGFQWNLYVNATGVLKWEME